MTIDEKKKEFVRQVKMLVEFWDKNEKCKSNKERLDGIAFSLLYLIDGKAEGLKDYIIAPGKEIENNISGDLSDLYYKGDKND